MNGNRTAYTEWITTLNSDWAEFKAAQGVSPELNAIFPYVPAVRVEAGGGSGLAAFDLENEITRDQGARHRDRETRGRKRSSTCLFEARKGSERPELDPLRFEEPPRKLPKCEVGDKGKEVLRQRRGLHSGPSIHTSNDESDMDDGSGASEEWSDEGSALDVSDDGEECEGSNTPPEFDFSQLRASKPSAYAALRTSTDELRDALRVGAVEDTHTLWRDEYGENDAGGESLTKGAVHAPFRPPRYTQGGPRGRYPGRHDVSPSTRRGSDRAGGHGDGHPGPCEVQGGNPACWYTKDSHDEPSAK